MSEQSFNTISEDEISIKDIIDFLAESWKTIVLGGVVGGLLGLGYGLIAPAKYQATANIQVAKVVGTDVEAPATLLEKLKMPMYYSEKTYLDCNLMDKSEPGEVILRGISPKLSKIAPIIAISYQEESPEKARKCLEAILNDIRFNQNILAGPIYKTKLNELNSLKLKIESAKNFLKKIPDKNILFDFSDSKFSSSTLLLATVINKEDEIKNLQNKIDDLEISLAEPQTTETTLATPIYASPQKVSPKITIILVAGLISGFFLGMLFMLAKRTLVRGRHKRLRLL